MAEKKSWRDYSKNYTEDESADNSTSSKKTGSWRDYSKSFSSDNRNTSNTSAIDWRNYAEKDTASIVGENLTNRVNTWLENHNNYITNYQTRNSGRKFNYEDSYVSDSADWLNTISQQKSAFDTEADSILAQLDQYKGYFNDEWVESVRKTLTDARSAQDIILANSTKDNEWWNSFGNAELVNAFGSAEDAYKYYQRSDGYRQKYAGQKYDDIQKALSTLEDGEEKDWLTNNQYEFYKDDTTYNSKSRSGWKSFEAQKIAEWKEEESKTWFDKALDSFATTPADTSLPNAGLINAQVAYTNDTTYREPNEKWSADQRNQFGYLWATDRDKAYEYAVQVNSQIADYEEYLAQQGAQQDATKNGWTMTGHTIGAIASAPLALGDLLGDLVEYSARGTITSDGMLSPFEYSQAVQSGIANKLNKVDDNGVAQSVLPDWVPIVGGKGWGDVYSLGVSAANSLVSAYTMGGAGTLINFIGQGGASGVDEALSRGASPGQALLYGAIVGAAEGATEMLSADKLIKVGSASTLKNYLLKALGQGVGEFAEEGVSSVIGNIADNIIMQDKSNFYDTVEQIMDKNPGMSEEEAKTKAWLDMVGDIAFDALGGFVTGATNAMTVGGVNTAVDAWKGNQQNIDAIKQYGEHTDALIQEGLQSDKNSESYQLAEKYQKKTEGGKALSGFQIRNLVKANDAQFVVEDYNEALPKAKERLKALGETKNVDKIADLVAKRVSRQELTRSEKSTLARSQFGAQVAKEMTTPTVETQNGTKIYNATYKSLEDRVGTEGRFGVSESGQATIRETNEAIDIGTLDVATVGDGQMTFKVAEDREVYAGDIDFADEDQSFLVSAVSDIENITPAAATAIMHDVVDTSKPLGAQLNGIDEAYTYGYNGYSVEDMKTGDFTSNLTDVQMMSAYRLGQSARSISDTDADAPIVKMRTAADAKLTAEQKTAKQKARIESKNVEVYFETGGTVTKFDEHTGKYDDKRMAAVNTAKFLSKLGIGGKYYFFESYENADGVRVYKDANGNEVEAPNGMYKDADGSIHIDLNAGNEGQGTALFTLGHELTHFVKAQSKKQFKILGDLVTEAFDKTDTSMHDRVVAKQDFLSKIRGHHVTYTEAFEEVVADAMSTMITDGSFHEKIMEIKVKDKGLFNTIKRFFEKMIAKFREVYAELTPDQKDARDIREMKDMFDKIQTAFAEALVEASDNFHAAMESVVEAKAEPMSADEIVTEGAVVTDGEGVRHSIRSMKHDIAEGKMFEDLKTVCGWTQAQVDTLKTQLKDLVEYMIPYRNILDMNEAYGAEGRRFSPYKPNSDPLYKISMDFSTLCSKRLLTQYVIEQLQLRENRPMSAEEQMAIRDMLNEYRKVEKGLQVACAMCYVEAARLKSPKQVQRWLDDPAPLLKDYFGKKNKEFNDSVKKAQADFKESKGYDREAPKKDMKPADVKELNKIGPKMRSQYQMSAEEQAIVERAKSLPNSTYLTAGNLATLSETDPVIYDAYTAFVRTATRSKSLEKDEPYYYGDSTRDNGNGIVVTDSFIEAVNKENGMRFSSWSDWRIQHLLDYITAVIDNSVRGAAMHGYTKFGDEVRVLGKTGMMFNMSGVAGTQTGLNEDGSLSFSPTESIDVNEAIQLREEFPEHAGLQCIGVSDEHIVALLRSDIIDYVIPYHVSGLNAVLRRMVNIYGWADYTGTQHASIDKSIKFENAVDQEHWHEEPVFSEFFVGYDTGMTGIDAMRASAEKYKQMCKDRGLTPKFNQFATEDNYWKLLIDRKMINQQTGKLIRQKAVTPTFDFDVIKGVVDKFVKNYDAGLEARALNHVVENWDSIPQRIKDLKKQGGTKAKKTKKAVNTLANQTVAAQPKDGVKNSDRYKEIAKGFTDHMVNIVNTKHGWYAKDVFKYVEEHPELGFIELIYAKDKDVKKLLEKFLNGVDDVKVLEKLSWYMGEAYGDKDRTWNPYDGATYPYRGAVRTFRNAIKKRINAIMTEKVGGTNLGIKNGEVTLEDIKGLYEKLNSNEEMKEFAEKVFATSEKLGVNIRFVNQTLSKQRVAGDNLGDMVEYKTSYFNDTAVTDQRKANTILHELIHACTVYVMEANKTMGDVSWNKSENYNKISNAATRLNRIYSQIAYDPDFRGQYGITNAKEMVAELANENFVGLMKKKNLWDQIVDWICDLFGIRRGTSAYDNARLCLDYILDNPEVSEYKAFAAQQRSNARYNGMDVFGQTRYSERVLMGSLFSGGGTLEAGLAYQMLDKQFGVEYDGKIASVYADNHGDHIQVGRVEDFNISKYDDIFYLHASPVCHNFSKAKHGAKELQMDIDSAKATAKHLETAMPQVFTVENAPAYRKSESLKIITDKLSELGYKWDVDVYNSADYGSATSRNRVILRAVKDGELPAKPTKQARTNSWDKVTRDLWRTLPKAELRPSFISAIKNTPNLPILDANGKVNVNKPLLILTTTSGHQVTFCWDGEVCPTLTTKCGEARLVMPDGNIYAVTPEFMGRIQGLPNDYKYPKEKTRAFTIIGNGIPTHLTKAVVGGVLDSAYEQTHEGKVLYSERDTTATEEVPYQTVLKNLNEYSREDLVSIADQVTDGTYTIAHSMSKDSLVTVLRETISIVGKDDPTLTFKLPVAEVEQGGDESVDAWILDDDISPFPWENTTKEVEPNYRPTNEEIKSDFEYMLSFMHNTFGHKHTTLEEFVKDEGVDAVVEEMLTDWGTEYGGTPTHKMIDSIQTELKAELGEDYDWDGDEMLFDRLKTIVEDVLANPTGGHEIRYSDRTAKIDTEGMSAEAKKIISNLELRTRFSRFSKGEYASYSTERIERELNRSSASEMDYAKSYIAWVKPIDFLYATTTSREGRMRIEDEAGGLDLDRLRDETQPIHLTVDFETGKIVGHEGRHRMTALNKAGVEKVAVIFDAWNDDRYNTKPVDMMRIGGQEFDRYHGGLDFYVHDMLPLSKRYADAAKKLFSEVDGSIKFSERGEGTSNRHLLANAFEGITNGSEEYKLIQRYKGYIAELNSLEAKLSDFNQQIRKIRFGKGEYDAEKLARLEDEARKIAEAINKYDQYLLSLEASEPLRKVIDRERAKARDDARQKNKAAMDRYRLKKEVKQSELMRDIRETKAALKNQKNETSIMEKEFIRIAKAYEKLDAKSTAKSDKDTKAIADLKAALKEEAKKHRDDQKTWEAEFSRLMREYELADRSIDRLEEKIERQKQAAKNKVESRQKTELRHKIQNFKKKLEAKLLRPTDRQYVPVDLIGAMVEVCNLIDTDTNLYKADRSINNAQVKRDETKEKLQNLKDEYEKLKNNSDPIYAGEFDEMVYAYLTELRDNFSGKSLKEMTTDELAEMYEILHAIDETLADARKLIGWGDAENVYEAGDSIVAEQDAIAKKRKNGKRNAVQKGWDTIDNLGLSPVRNVERMSGYNQDSALLKLFKKFEQGVRKKNKFKMDAYKLFEQLTSGKEYDDAIYNEVGGKKYTDVKGRQFGISKMQMMQSILSWERETANKSLHHIEQGGFTFADLDMLRKGNLKDAVSAENSHRVPAAVEMVAEFQEILNGDKWCQDYMAVARSFFNGMAKDAINETSISLKHRIIAKDKNYIPFEVDKNFVNTEITDMDAVQQTINSYGMLKDTKNHAPQALYITGLNNILDRHIEQVGTVYGLAIEVRNFNKVWNVRSQDESGNDPTVKESIDTNWGKEGVKHIEQAVKDIQGSRVRERNPLYDKAKSGYIGATFLLNLSVVTKQVGSLFSSTSMLRWRDPAKMIGNLIYTMANSEKIAAEVDKYTATAWMRRQGMSDAELYTLMTQAKKPGLLKAMSKLPAVFNPTKWITAMDHAVALSLWKYAKQDTAKRTGLDGEALLKATAAFYDEVVENTQSMTDVLHRPEIQKRGDVLSESFAMFKTDLYQMAGQLQATAGRFMANKSEENGKALGRTVYAIAMGAIWGSLMTTVFALLRYKVNRYRDDEDDELTIESWLKRQGFALVGDLAGYIFPIFGSEVVGVFENIMYGESDDVVDSIALTAINDLYSTMMTIGTSIKDGEMPDAAKMRQLSAKALQVFGIPANNILRALDAIKLHAEDIANGEFLSFNAGADSKTDDIYEAIMAGDQAYLSRLKSTYKDDSAYQSAVRKALRENDPRIHDAAQAKYEGRTEEYKRIFREIQKEGKFSFDDIMSAVNSEESAIRNKLEPDKATSSYTASDFVESIVLGDSKSAEAMKEDIIATKVANGKTQAEAEKEFISSVATGIRDAYSSGLLDEAGAEKMLMEYADKDEEEAASKVGYWGFCEDNPKYDYFSESNVKDYREFAEPENISLEVYAQFINGTKGLADIKDKWGDVEVTKREQVLEVIDSLPLTWAQKDALYLAAGYSESKIWDVPW